MTKTKENKTKENKTNETVNKRGVKTLLKKIKSSSAELYEFMNKFAGLETTSIEHLNYILENLPSIVVLYDLANSMAAKNEKLINEKAVKFNKVYKKYNISFNSPNEARIIKRFLIVNGFVKKLTDRKEQNRYLFLNNPDIEIFKKSVDEYCVSD
jgi:hypothetical protein